MKIKEEILIRLTEIMFENEQTFLSLDELYEDEYLSPHVRNIQIDSPYQQLLFDGVLSQYNYQNEIVVSFTIEAYFHHMLSKVLQKDERYQSAESLLELIQNSKLLGLKEGVSNLFSYDVEVFDFKRLTDFIDLNEEGIDILDLCVQPVMHSILVSGVDHTLKTVMENQTKNDWEIIMKVTALMGDLQMHTLQKEFLTTIMPINSLDSKNKVIIALKGILFLNKQLAQFYLDKITEHSIYIDDHNIHNDLGRAFQRIGDYDRSILYYKKCLATRLNDENLKAHPSIAVIYNNLGQLNSIKGFYKKALEYFNLSMKINLNCFGPDSILVADLLNNIAFNYYSNREYNRSIENFEKSINIYEKRVGFFSKEVATSFNNLGLVYSALKEFDLGVEYHSKSLQIRLKLFGKNDYNVAYSYGNLGSVLYKQKKYGEALIYFETNLKIIRNFFGENHSVTATSYNNIGGVYKSINDFKNALIYAKKALKIKNLHFDKVHHEVALAEFNIALIYKSLKKFKTAIYYLKKSLKSFKLLGKDLKYILNCLIEIVECYEALNDQENALDYYILSAEIRKEDPDVGLEAESTIESINNAKRLAKQLNKENELPQWIKNIN